jgi:hypothetical protein
MIGHEKACIVCTLVLSRIEEPDGRTRYEHPIGPHDDHDPVPVPAEGLPAAYRRCHFCSEHEPVWEYRTDPIAAVIDGPDPLTRTYSTRWQACWLCAQLIDDDNPAALTRRAASVVGWPTGDVSSNILGILYRAVVLTREPGKTLLTTTRWSRAELRASVLPKVRDRLGELVRGPHGLPGLLADRQRRDAIAAGLDRAKLYWIDPEFTALIAEVHADLPPTHITDRIVPAGDGLLVWPRPASPRFHITAASWTTRPGGWDILCYRSIGPGLPDKAMADLRHQVGWLLPIHAATVPRGHCVDGQDPLASLVTALLLIAQQLTVSEATAVEPKIRKSYARARRTPPDVRLVRIKPTVPRPQAAAGRVPRAKTGRAEPDHRFWVSGHERQQAYGPGSSLRRLIVVDPFLKGPEDLPIKASTTVRILGGANGNHDRTTW